ncbi:SGNH/GDSL hydrolase family protein [Kitasatospora sp. NPDC054939]
MWTHRRPTAVVTAVLAASLLAGCTGDDDPPSTAGAAASPARTGAATAERSPAAPTTPPPVGPYVALGDSYTSGLKIAPQVGEPTGCARSAVNYPSLVAKELGLSFAEVRDVSCSSARTGDLTGPQKVSGGVNPPQLDALTPATRLVTVGIGGNDAGFMEVVGQCAKENLVDAVKGLVTEGGRGAAPCREHYSSADGAAGDQVQRKVDEAGERLGRVLQEIKRRSPQARVLVVGYPSLLPADPLTCVPVLGRAVAPADLGFLAEKEQQLNAMLRGRAQAAGAVFVDTAGPSAGHDMCSGEGVRWVEPPFPAAGLAAIHPNARGQQGVATAVLKAIRP